MIGSSLLASLRSFAASIGMGIAVGAPAPIRAGRVLPPVFSFPKPKQASRTYGAMPVDHYEVAAWNAAVREANRAKGKFRL